MPRRRLCVALLPPPPLASLIDALRLGLADDRLTRLPPHLTLVPPVNVAEQDLAVVREVVRRSAAATPGLALSLGPAASFAPRTPTVHLAVDGALAELAELRDRLRGGPFDRPDEHTFHPHVTLRRSFPKDRIPGALQALTGILPPWEADRLHVLEHVQDEEHGPRWIVASEEPFGRPEVVGRGGIELLLRTLRTVEPTLEDLVPGLVADERPPEGRLVVVAESTAEPGSAVGAAVGSLGAGVAVLRRLHVEPDRRRTGIARHVLARACTDAARRGAHTVVVDPEVTPTEPSLAAAALASCGFVPVEGLWLRRCGPAPSN